MIIRPLVHIRIVLSEGHRRSRCLRLFRRSFFLEMKPSRSTFLVCCVFPAYLLYHSYLPHSYLYSIFSIFVRHELGEQGHCLLCSLDQGRRTVLHWRQMLTHRITRDSVSHWLPYAAALQQNMKFNVNKFELLRCANEQEIKSASPYLAGPSSAPCRHHRLQVPPLLQPPGEQAP